MNQETKEAMLYHFAPELGRISNPSILELVSNALVTAPNYFWEVPASSSGKYHPDSSLGFMGLIRHVKAVFRISEEILDNNTYTGHFEHWTSDDLDLIRGAILLHDSAKQGDGANNNAPGSTVHEHPVLVRTTCMPSDSVMNSNPMFPEWWDTMCTMLESHMGEWNTRNNSKVVLPLPTTPAQKHIHLCDYIASRKSINVNVYAEMSPKRAFPTDSLVLKDEELVEILQLLKKKSPEKYSALISSSEYKEIFKKHPGKTALTRDDLVLLESYILSALNKK